MQKARLGTSSRAAISSWERGAGSALRRARRNHTSSNISTSARARDLRYGRTNAIAEHDTKQRGKDAQESSLGRKGRNPYLSFSPIRYKRYPPVASGAPIAGRTSPPTRRATFNSGTQRTHTSMSSFTKPNTNTTLTTYLTLTPLCIAQGLVHCAKICECSVVVENSGHGGSS